MAPKWKSNPALALGSVFPTADTPPPGPPIPPHRNSFLASADVVLRVRKLPLEEIALLKSGCVHVSLLDPFNEKELIQKLAERGVSAISMEFDPAHYPRAKDGRAVVAGEPRRL